MAATIIEWTLAEYQEWLEAVPRSYGMTQDELFAAYLMGRFEDDDDVWEWAQFYNEEWHH